MKGRFAAAVLCTLIAIEAAAARRAVLIGINDYSATSFPQGSPPNTSRDWRNLKGAVNDVRAFEEMLVLLYGFERHNVVTLVDQAASRTAILQAIERHLVRSAAPGDVVLLYFAGHGSQVRNSGSDEPDRYDESIIAADSRAGASDIRDKELRPLFNRILDRGAKLSILFDSCHSGSGARGLPGGLIARGIEPDERDISDRGDYGPRPEERGALVISATADFDRAWETRDEQGGHHGAFSWAWLRAMRDATAGESARDTFLRAHARMAAETPFQEPILGGKDTAQRAPFLGTRIDRDGDRVRIAVERVQRDGTVSLRGGWANGLAVGTTLRIANDAQNPARLTVTSLLGLGQSIARIDIAGKGIRSGALLEAMHWAAPPGRPLRVWIPQVPEAPNEILTIAKRIHDAATSQEVHWLSDPIHESPAQVLRRSSRAWELIGQRGLERFTTDETAVAKLRTGATLFAQLPVSHELAAALAIDEQRDRIELVDDAIDADYILAGRYASRRLQYAWLRPYVTNADRRKTPLPVATRWIPNDTSDDSLYETARDLRDSLLRLRRIHAWLQLESPPESAWAYSLAIRRTDANAWAESIIGGERYELVLRLRAPRVQHRHVYVFVVDSLGKSMLLYPTNGSVENRLPIDLAAAPKEIPLHGTFKGAPPYGVDTFFLLTTDDPLTNAFVLEWEGVRGRGQTIPSSRNWSIERLSLESIAP